MKYYNKSKMVDALYRLLNKKYGVANFKEDFYITAIIRRLAYEGKHLFALEVKVRDERAGAVLAEEVLYSTSYKDKHSADEALNYVKMALPKHNFHFQG